MDYGVHLPLIGFGERPPSLLHLMQYTETAESLGFAALSANDHLVFSRPWLDGPTALSSVLDATARMDLMTTVALPVVRGPVALAKSMAAIDILSGGRLIVGVGPGSSVKDYAATGIPFEERFKRLDESVETLRALWCEDGPPFRGNFYSTEGIVSGAATLAATGTSDLDRQLGLGSRPSPHRPPGRRLAGLSIQHNPRRVRRCKDPTGTTPARRGQGPRPLPQRHRHHVPPRNR